MTNTPNPADAVEVTPEDVDLAGWFTRRMDAGETYRPQVEQLLARHRLATSTPEPVAPTQAPDAVEREICPDCNGAGGDNSTYVCGLCGGNGGVSLKAPNTPYLVEGSIYEPMEAAISCDGVTVAHCWKYSDAVQLADKLNAALTLPTADAGQVAEPFQQRVKPWMDACFGAEISADRLERNDRFMEEAIELVQATGYPKERAYALVDYVYGREQGEINQEAGGVMVTLAAHCLAHGVDMHEAAETELGRIWTKVEQIRAKQAAKPTGSALPIAPPYRSTSEQAPIGYLYKCEGHVAEFGTLHLTAGDRAAGWTETPLYTRPSNG